MKSRALLASITAALVFTLCGSASAFVVENGGFETGFSGSTNWLDGDYPDPWYKEIHGATMTDDENGDGVWTGTGLPDIGGAFEGIRAFEGKRYAVLFTPIGASYHSVNQRVGPIRRGERYVFTASMVTDNRGKSGYGATYGSLGEAFVMINDTEVGRLEANTEGLIWEERSATFTWEGDDLDDAILRIGVYGDSNFIAVGIDNVGVVPEPATIGALAAGLVGLAIRRRRAR